jgi:hypothetical protein
MTKPEYRLTPAQAVVLEALPRPQRRAMLAMLQTNNPIRKAALRAQIIRAEARQRGH